MQQQEIRITFFIIGIVIISAVLLHGLWTIRKNKKKSKRTSFESKNWEPGFQHEDDLDDDGPFYDDIGVGKARVILNPEKQDVDSVQDKLKAQTIDNDELNGDYPDLESSNIVNDAQLEQSEHKEQSQDVSITTGIAKDNISDINSRSNTQLNADSESFVSSMAQSDETSDNSSANDNIESESSVGETNNEVQIEVAEQEQSPVYSNVVTQPKPEFSRPVVHKENVSENFGQPPEFLLKKSEQGLDVDVDNNSFAQTPTQEASKGIDKPLPQQDIAPEPDIQSEPDTSPEFSLNIQEGPKRKEIPKTEAPGVEKELSFAEQAKRFVRRNKKTVADKIRKEPVLKAPSEDQMRIDFDDNEATISSDETPDSNNQQVSNSAPSEPYTGEPEVLVLNVRADNENPIEGAALLPMLLTLGFKFGEHDIFHRHVNTNGKGPILFSLTNMFKPGVFDIDNIENFNTLGVSLFMMLPIEGDAQQVFNMMHNAARKLSEEFGCRILDGNKVGLSKQSLQQYVERIRDFERKRINK